MVYQFGNKQSFSVGGIYHSWIGSEQTVYRAYENGSSQILVDVLGSQGWTTTSSGNVVDNTTANITSIPLNEPFCLDPLTSKLHLLYATLESSGSKPVLYHKSSSDGGSTWSSRHTLDDGTIHSTNRFYRVGIVAYNDYLTCVYVSLDGSLFTSDGLYEVHSSDAGATWSSPAKLYTSPVDPDEPNIYLGEDGTAHICWYDPGVLSNTGGDVYYAGGTFNGAGWTWPGSASRLTTSELWGRTRIFGSNGTLMITGNINWPSGPNVDVGLLRSTDNGASWGTTHTVGYHLGTNFTSHPWGDLSGDRGAIVWLLNTTPQQYYVIFTTNAGACWTSDSPIVPFTSASSSGDAPFLALTRDTVVAAGIDGTTEIWASYPLFAPDPAITASIDNFNRADENPLSNGGKWTLGLGLSNNLKLVSNQIRRQLGSGSFDRSADYRNDASYTGSCEIYIDCVTAGGQLCLDFYTSAQSGYQFSVNDGNDFATNALINLWSAGSFVGTEVSDGVTVQVSGDRYCLRLDLNCVVGLRYNSATGKWMELVRWTDTTQRTSMLGEVELAGTVGVPVFDNFGGGQLFAPVNVTAPWVKGAARNGQTIYVSEGSWATGLGKDPTRFGYQWQSSANQGSTWSNISRAVLPFYTVTATDSTQYRCQVTAKNSIGTTTVNSPAISANRYLLVRR